MHVHDNRQSSRMNSVWRYFMLALLIAVSLPQDSLSQWDALRLPDEHIPYYFNNNPDVKKQCEEDPKCPYKNHLLSGQCWGYEKGNCPKENRMGNPVCRQDSRGWASSKVEQLDMFWKAGDFGYIKERKGEIKTYCQPEHPDDSMLECVKYTRHCRAKNIYFDFTNAKLNEGTDRYRENMFKEGQVGGHCRMNRELLKKEGEHKSPLQSWFAELEEYSSLPFRPIHDNKCDLVIDKPTYLMKLDAGINLFHHFCDFVNLYAAQHLNNSFGLDVQIIMWDTSPMMYRDFFEVTWKAFSHHPVIPLKDFDGKKVCFRDAVFPLLPRMRFGMYYNMPLIPGCHGSSFFRAFSQHLMYRLNRTQDGPLENKIRITLLSRSTKYRQIMNEQELISAMKTEGEFEVNRVDLNWNMPFIDQIQISLNSDIFIGMHGAGLSHVLFQPDWAVLMEIYNCEDKDCYYDLARLRGVKYMTWEKKEKLTQEDEGHHPTLGAHAKFTNYAFNVPEFMRLVYKAADHVRSHPTFVEGRKNRYSSHSDNVKDEL